MPKKLSETDTQQRLLTLFDAIRARRHHTKSFRVLAPFARDRLLHLEMTPDFKVTEVALTVRGEHALQQAAKALGATLSPVDTPNVKAA